MRLITKMTKVKKLLFTGIATQHPVKLLFGLALGALLVAGMGLSFRSTDADKPGSPSTPPRGLGGAFCFTKTVENYLLIGPLLIRFP